MGNTGSMFLSARYHRATLSPLRPSYRSLVGCAQSRHDSACSYRHTWEPALDTQKYRVGSKYMPTPSQVQQAARAYSTKLKSTQASTELDARFEASPAPSICGRREPRGVEYQQMHCGQSLSIWYRLFDLWEIATSYSTDEHTHARRLPRPTHCASSFFWYTARRSRAH